MHTCIGLLAGISIALLIRNRKRALAWFFTHNPPATHADCRPRYRTWKNGIEIVSTDTPISRVDALRAIFATESEREVVWETISTEYGEGVRVAAGMAFREGWDRCLLALVPLQVNPVAPSRDGIITEGPWT